MSPSFTISVELIDIIVRVHTPNGSISTSSNISKSTRNVYPSSFHTIVNYSFRFFNYRFFDYRFAFIRRLRTPLPDTVFRVSSPDIFTVSYRNTCQGTRHLSPGFSIFVKSENVVSRVYNPYNTVTTNRNICGSTRNIYPFSTVPLVD